MEYFLIGGIVLSALGFLFYVFKPIVKAEILYAINEIEIRVRALENKVLK